MVVEEQLPRAKKKLTASTLKERYWSYRADLRDHVVQKGERDSDPSREKMTNNLSGHRH